MHVWTVDSDPATGSYTHSLPSGVGHALLTPVVGSIFQFLGVSASLFDGRLWWVVHSEPNVMRFEVAQNRASDRDAYNTLMFARVLSEARALLGEHGGCSDLFVPVFVRGAIAAVLVVGPFFTTRPTAAKLLERWRALTGRVATLSDPEFSAFLSASLSTLVLDPAKLDDFTSLLEAFARLLGGDGSADDLANQAHALRLRVEKARDVERTWSVVRDMIDPRFSLAHLSASMNYDLQRVGLVRAPDQVLVALAVARGADLDPIEAALRRDAFQRAAVSLAREAKDSVAGQVGDFGVVFLCGAKGNARNKRKKILALVERAARLAKQRFGLTLHFGASLDTGPMPVNKRYDAALAAAESAVTRNVELVETASNEGGRSGRIRQLREALVRDIEQNLKLLPARFDHYFETVAIERGYRLEPVRAELEISFERVSGTLELSGAIDPRSLQTIRETLDRVADEARTVKDLFAAYSSAMADMARSVESPVQARRERSLRRALDYIRQHYGERLTRDRVAQVAGFASKHFSALFKQREKKTFERYLFEIRLERAKQLITGTDLSMLRIAELSGFHSPQYLNRVFQREVGCTPRGYRFRLQPHLRKRRRVRTDVA